MSQEDLAGKMAVRANEVSRWECGRRLPRHSRQAKLAKILGVQLAWLMTGEGDREAVSAS